MHRVDAGDEGYIHGIAKKVFCVRSAYEHSSHWLMPGRLRETSEASHTYRLSHLITVLVICD